MSRAPSRSASNSGRRSAAWRAALGEADVQLGQRVLQIGIGQRARATFALKSRGWSISHQPVLPSGSPIGGVSPMPASTSATWRTAHRAAFALQLAGHVHQAAEIARQQRVGAGGGDVGRLVARPWRRRSPDISRRRCRRSRSRLPASGISLSVSPATDASRRRGCCLDAELAQARAGIVIGRRCRRSAPRPRSTPRTSTRKDISS